MRKSNPGLWENILVTGAFYVDTKPSKLCLILKTHLHSTGILPSGSGIIDQVLFVDKACKSSLNFFDQWGSWRDRCMLEGLELSRCIDIFVTAVRAAKIEPPLDLVCISWIYFEAKGGGWIQTLKEIETSGDRDKKGSTCEDEEPGTKEDQHVDDTGYIRVLEVDRQGSSNGNLADSTRVSLKEVTYLIVWLE